jgi:hypothetical protein
MRAWHAGAALRRMRALPWCSGMVLTDTSAILAAGAFGFHRIVPWLAKKDRGNLVVALHPAPHPSDIVVISSAELAVHLGFLKGNVDPADSSKDSKRRD